MHFSAQIEYTDLAMPGDEFTQRQIHRLTLRPRTDQALSLAQDLVIDVDVRPHTHHVAPLMCNVPGLLTGTAPIEIGEGRAAYGSHLSHQSRRRPTMRNSRL